jgi:hypothetical protein
MRSTEEARVGFCSHPSIVEGRYNRSTEDVMWEQTKSRIVSNRAVALCFRRTSTDHHSQRCE